MQEPLQAFFGPPGGDESVGVGVEETGSRCTGPLRVEIGRLQGDDGLVVLTEIHAGAGQDDAQLCCLVAGQLASFLAPAQFERLLRATETAFAVGHDGEQSGTTGHAACCAEFGQRLRPLTGVIGGDAGGLADDRDAAGALTGGASMRERGAGIVVEQATGHHQMPGDGVRVRLVQAQQIATDRRVELGRLDVVGDIRLVRACVATLRRDAFAPAARTESAFTATTTGCSLATTVAGLGATAVAGIASPVAATALVTASALVATTTIVAVTVAALTAGTVRTLTGTVAVLPTAIVAAARTVIAVAGTIVATAGAVVASGTFAVGTVAASGASIVAAAIPAVSALEGTTVVATLGTLVVTALGSPVFAALGTSIVAALGASIVAPVRATIVTALRTVVASGRTSGGSVATLAAVVAASTLVAVAGCALASAVVGAILALVLAARPRSGSSTPEGPTFTVAVGHRKILS